MKEFQKHHETVLNQILQLDKKIYYLLKKEIIIAKNLEFQWAVVTRPTRAVRRDGKKTLQLNYDRTTRHLDGCQKSNILGML